jgi:nicotinic acid phosphoribosyltransferase
VELVVRLARELGSDFRVQAVRIDSGDLARFALERLGLPGRRPCRPRLGYLRRQAEVSQNRWDRIVVSTTPIGSIPSAGS